MQCAKKKGAYRVIVVDVLDGKLELAKKLGVDITINLKKDKLKEIIDEITNGVGDDVVIEAAGTQESFNLESDIIKYNGKFVLYSWVT